MLQAHHRLVLVSALAVETRRLRDAPDSPVVRERAGAGGLLDGCWDLEFPDGRTAVVAATGAGAARAAAGLATVLGSCAPALVLGVGVAGGLRDELAPGDLVVAERVTQYDHDATALGLPPGALERGQASWLEPASAAQRSALVELLARVAPATRIHVGPVASGGTLLTAGNLAGLPATARGLLGEALACDMESAAWAGVCLSARVPFLSLRILSDVVPTSRRMGVGRAADRLGEVLLGLLQTCRIMPDGAIVGE